MSLDLANTQVQRSLKNAWEESDFDEIERILCDADGASPYASELHFGVLADVIAEADEGTLDAFRNSLNSVNTTNVASWVTLALKASDSDVQSGGIEICLACPEAYLAFRSTLLELASQSPSSVQRRLLALFVEHEHSHIEEHQLVDDALDAGPVDVTIDAAVRRYLKGDRTYRVRSIVRAGLKSADPAACDAACMVLNVSESDVLSVHEAFELLGIHSKTTIRSQLVDFLGRQGLASTIAATCVLRSDQYLLHSLAASTVATVGLRTDEAISAVMYRLKHMDEYESLLKLACAPSEWRTALSLNAAMNALNIALATIADQQDDEVVPYLLDNLESLHDVVRHQSLEALRRMKCRTLAFRRKVEMLARDRRGEVGQLALLILKEW